MLKTTLHDLYREMFGPCWGDGTLYAGIFAELKSKMDTSIYTNEDAITYVPSIEEFLVAGKVYRNPIDASIRANYMNSCSRDMFSGALLGISAERKKFQALRLARRLSRDKGILCEQATDGRKKVTLSAWAELSLLLSSFGYNFMEQRNIMGIKYTLIGYALRPLLGIIMLLSVYTSFMAYQTHLVMASLLFLRSMNKQTMFYRFIIQALEIRYSGNNGMLNYIKGDKKKVEDCLATLVTKPDFLCWSAGAAFEQWLSNELPCRLYKIYMKVASDSLSQRYR